MPRRIQTCTRCAAERPAHAIWPIGPVCRNCYDTARANPGHCAGCERNRVLVAENHTGQPICGACAGVGNDHACQRCGASGNRHRRLVRPFAKWVLLRRARRRAQTRPITQGSVNGMRSRVLIALHFLAWLETIDLALAELTQAHVDQWLDDGTTYHYSLRPFLAWARSRRLTGDVEVPSLPVGTRRRPATPNRSNGSSYAAASTTPRCRSRCWPAAFCCCFGISASRQVQLSAEAIEHIDTTTHLRVAQHALLLPPRLADLAIQQRDRTDLRSIFGRTGVTCVQWLFPGLRPPGVVHLRAARRAGQLRPGRRARRLTAGAILVSGCPPRGCSDAQIPRSPSATASGP
ncbi:hypothetical protein Prum_070650 [Phytohabitans rumicis]|uniref:Uncharacterized protein n=1 Tax=Phytohabitans rumicis TaxID=1076125 RepID=A0A6V8L831_9ACTN|nr:hypothetical protein Prum_070650 [Phytohabitans rumicis]